MMYAKSVNKNTKLVPLNVQARSFDFKTKT